MTLLGPSRPPTQLTSTWPLPGNWGMRISWPLPLMPSLSPSVLMPCSSTTPIRGSISLAWCTQSSDLPTTVPLLQGTNWWRFAREVELPGVIAHGMFTMGAAVQLVTDWVGDPSAVVSFGTRFTKPVPVADLDGAPGAVVQVSGVVGALDAEARTVRIDLTVSLDGQKVLVKAQATVRLA